MKKNIYIILIFLIFTLVMTYPLVLKINTHIPGFFSTDESYASIWDSWRIKNSFQNNLSLTYTNSIAYPFGINLYASGYISYIWLGLFYFLSILTNPIFTYNFQVFCNLFLSGFFTYILVFYLTRNEKSAFLSGIIFAFCSYQFARIWQHLGLTYNQWIPLCLATAILLKEKNTKKYSVLFFASLLLLFSFDHSIMYLTTIGLLTFLAYVILYRWKVKFFRNEQLLNKDYNYIKKVIFAVIFAVILLLPQFLPIIINRLKFSPSLSVSSAFNPYYRPFEDLFSQSARPLSYLLPATTHPIFGKFTEQFIGSSLYGDSLTEHALYLGWMPLILAFVAFRKWKRKRKELKLGAVPFGEGTYKDDFYIGFFILLAIVAWLFSQPPWWKMGSFKIYMPSFFMYKILPMFRAYCRFGIVLMLAVAALAGFGLKFILERFKTQKAKFAVTILFCGLVLFEFWNYPPFKVIDVYKVPTVYYWLKDQPGDIIIAEYPLDAMSPNEMYKLYQTRHEKKIINGTIPGTYANKVAQAITKLSDFHTAGALKWMGVKYVIVHKEEYLKTELIEETEEINKIPKNPGLKLIRSFPAEACLQKDIMCIQKSGPIDIYEVIAKPSKLKIKE